MPYKNPDEQRAADGRYRKRMAVKEGNAPALHAPLGKIGFSSPRLVIRAIENAVQLVRDDPATDTATIARIQLDAARIATLVHQSNIDAKIDALAAQVNAVKAANQKAASGAKLMPLALPGDTIDADFSAAPAKRGVGRPKKSPLAGLDEWGSPEAAEQFRAGKKAGDLPRPAYAKNNRGRKPSIPVPSADDLPNVPDSGTFSDALESFVERADEDLDAN